MYKYTLRNPKFICVSIEIDTQIFIYVYINVLLNK